MHHRSLKRRFVFTGLSAAMTPARALGGVASASGSTAWRRTRERADGGAGRRHRQLLLVLIAALLAGLGFVVTPAADAAATGGLRDFDGVSTISEKHNVWKHMAVLGDKYVIFNDYGIIEGPAPIRYKWPFLPERFTHNLDGVGVHNSGNYRWQHTWVKGNEIIVFNDYGMIFGPTQQSQTLDAFSTYTIDSPRNVGYVSVKGGAYSYSSSLGLLAPPVQPLSSIPGLPAQFWHDLDEVSFEIPYKRPLAMSFYKDNERLILENGRILEWVRLDYKWPFLNGFRAG